MAQALGVSVTWTGEEKDVTTEIEKVAAASRKADRFRYSEESDTSMRLPYSGWISCTTLNPRMKSRWRHSTNGKEQLKRPLFTPILNALCRLCAQRDETKPASLAYATESYTLNKEERSEAESTSDGYLEVARAILTTKQIRRKGLFQ